MLQYFAYAAVAVFTFSVALHGAKWILVIAIAVRRQLAAEVEEVQALADVLKTELGGTQGLPNIDEPQVPTWALKLKSGIGTGPLPTAPAHTTQTPSISEPHRPGEAQGQIGRVPGEGTLNRRQGSVGAST
jgi:hypothetical protein